MSQAIKNLQQIINNIGINPKLVIDGDLGPKTKEAIDKLDIPLHLKIALKEIGTKEIIGPKHSKQVLKYHSVAGGFTTDEVPWCGSFVAWVMLQAHYQIVKYPARALSWKDFGIHIDEPVTGAIAVKTRKGGGHVCIVVGENEDGKLLCVGGNQNNEVNIATYDKNIFTEFRIPATMNKHKLQMFASTFKTNIINEA